MIDVDVRGRTAATDLNRAAREAAQTEAALAAVIPGRSLVELAAGELRPRRRLLPVGLAAAGLLLVAAVGVLVARAGNDDGAVTVLPGSATSPTHPPASISAGEVSTATGPETLPPPTVIPALAGRYGVADADALPAVVIAGDIAGSQGVAVDGRLVIEGRFDLALQAPDGSVVLGSSGGGLQRSTGDAPTELWSNASWIGAPVLGDVAVVEGDAQVVFTISCGAGPQCRNDVFGGALDGAGAQGLSTISASVSDGTKVPVTFGRMSSSDTGLVVGVSTWLDSQVHVVMTMPGLGDPSREGELTALYATVGLDMNTTDLGAPDSPQAVTVDQSGRVVAWLDANGVHLVDITTGERRTVPVAERPDASLPVLDLALTGPGLAAGAVLLSAPGQPAYVVDLADASQFRIPDVLGAATFGAKPPS